MADSSAQRLNGGEESASVRIDPPTDFPPQEDGYERLWTPQRMSYVLRKNTHASADANSDADSVADSSSSSSQNEANSVESAKSAKPAKECPFCAGPRKSDEDALICWRGTYVFAVLNLYPYNTGHLMICPYRHVSYITDLSDDELFEFEKATTLAMTVMKNVSHPDGWNIGINQGEVAGAGVADHLHQHVVPRWNGDANFMPIIAQTRTMPVLLSNQRAAYAKEFTALQGKFGLPLRAKNEQKSR